MTAALNILVVRSRKKEGDEIDAMLSAIPQWQCVTTCCMDDAVSLITRQQFDVVILDMSLPDFENSDVIFELKQIVDSPILLLADNSSKTGLKNVITQGASDVLFRNHLTAFQLEQAIQQSLERHKLEQEKQKLIGDLVEASFENERILDQLQAANEQLTEEIALRNKTENQNALLVKAIHQISDEVVISSLDHTVVYRNRAFKGRTGVGADSDAIPLFSAAGMCTPESWHIVSEIETAVARGDEWRGTIKRTDEHNRIVTEQLSVFPIRGESEQVTHYVAIRRDVTHERELEQRLRQSQKLESIGQLAAGIAHEINTPTQYVSDNVRFLNESFDTLNSVLSQHLELLDTLQKEHADDESIRQYMNRVESADLDFLLEEIPLSISQSEEGLSRITQIVLAMKEFSHPGQDEKVPADINKAITNTVQVCANEWKYLADVQFALEDDLPPIPCFIGALNQVFLNMIVNSAHAISVLNNESGKKGIIRIETKSTKSEIVISISDTGCGIPEEIINRVFDPFFTTKDVGKGTGQGLSMAYTTVVEMHSGKIDIESTPGSGTRFTIHLPLEQSQPSESPES